MSLNDRTRLQGLSDDLQSTLRAFNRSNDGVAVIKAPPGSGKTYTLLQSVADAYRRGSRVAVACQTNSQADDICRRLSTEHSGVLAFRLGGSQPYLPGLPRVAGAPKHCVVVSTVAKWGLITMADPFDVVFVDEAWQMPWMNFMLLGQVAPRFVLIGDPGQIAPVVTIPVGRWETSPRAPHLPTPQLILADPTIPAVTGDLPACRRLPADAVDLVRPFYDFEFGAWARPGERIVETPRARDGGDRVDPAIDMLGEGSVSILTVETPSDGPPFERDTEVARLAAHVVGRILSRGAMAAAEDDGVIEPLTPADIGISATHRAMNGAIERALPADLAHHVKVDTVERWQGLERKVMIVVHPLSGVVHPSSFDLGTGRLCVMASRHRSGMIVLSRDHVPDTLGTHIPDADQAIGHADLTGRGHHQHSVFWETLESRGRIARVA